jgi:nucleoside-diphosphate kinase
MTIQRTFSIIKPDATKRNLSGAINAKFEAAGLSIIAQKKNTFNKATSWCLLWCT